MNRVLFPALTVVAVAGSFFPIMRNAPQHFFKSILHFCNRPFTVSLLA